MRRRNMGLGQVQPAQAMPVLPAGGMMDAVKAMPAKKQRGRPKGSSKKGMGC